MDPQPTVKTLTSLEMDNNTANDLEQPDDDITLPYDLILSHEPYDHFLNITVELWGHHPTAGLIFSDNAENRLILTGMERSSPGHRIPKFRSTLINATPIRVANTNPQFDHEIANIADLEEMVKLQSQAKQKEMIITFGTVTPVALHPQSGNPQIHQDQLNAVQKVLLQIKRDRSTPTIQQLQNVVSIHSDPEEIKTNILLHHQPNHYESLPDLTPVLDADPELSQKFTLKQLKQREDWPEWRKSQFKQLCY